MMHIRRGTPLTRFQKRVDTRTPDVCWEWRGAKNTAGYGKMWVEGKIVDAHRVAYMLYVGPIGDGLLVCHTCDQPSCVNPAHLFLGTYTDNMQDAKAKGRTRNGNTDRTVCRRGHPLSGRNVYTRPDGSKRYCVTCQRASVRRWKERHCGNV